MAGKRQRQLAKVTATTPVASESDPRPVSRTLYLVWQVRYRTFVHLEAALQPQGVTTTQFRILTTLLHGGKRSSAELSRMFGVTPQTMIKQIALLESSGLIERRLAKGSRRILEVTLTEAGRVALRACDAAAAAIEAEIFACLTPAELQTYRTLMQKVLAALRGSPGESDT